MSCHHFTIEERCCLREYYKKRIQLSKNCRINGTKCKQHITGTTQKLHTYVRCSNILSAYRTEKE